MNEEKDSFSLKDWQAEDRPEAGVHRYWPVLLLLLVGTVISLFVFRTARTWEEEHILHDFENHVLAHVDAFQKTLDLARHELEALQAFYDASEKVTRSEFQQYAKNLLSTNATIHALEWIPRVRAQERASYEEAARAEGLRAFEITERDAQGNLVTAGRRDEYFPVYYLEPYVGNEAALGYDLASNPTRLHALVEARNTGRPNATGRIRLVLERGDQYRFLIFHPVYDKDVPLQSPKDRLRNLQGFVLAVFRIGDMLAQTMQPLDQADIQLHLLDQSAREEERFLSSYPSQTEESREPESVIEAKLRSGIHHAKTFDVLGREWLLLSTPTPRFFATRTTRQPWALLIGGLSFTAMLSAYSWISMRQNIQTRHWAHQLMQSRKNLEDEAEARQRVQKNLDQRVRIAEMRVRIGKALTKGERLGPMLQECAEAVVAHLDIDLARIWTLDEPGAFLQLQASTGLFTDPDASAGGIPVGTYPIGSIVTTQTPSFTNDLFQHGGGAEWEWVPGKDFVAFAGYPLIVEDRVVGVLAALSRTAIKPVTAKALASVSDEIAIGVTRIETEELLRRERDRIQTYLDVAGVMLLVLNADRRVALINRQGCQILGYEEKEILGRDWFDTFLPKANREEVGRVFRRLMAGELAPFEYFENPVVTKCGDEKLIAWHNTALRDKTGKIIGTLSSGEDISQRRKMEDEHLKMEKLESLGVLAGGLAHDFNNLLTGILSNVGLAKLTAGSPEETVERLEEAERASLRARDLIQQLLTFSKGGAPIRKSVSMVELVRESVGFALRGSNVACEYQMGEDLLPVSVDESQIIQVIHNLILNADQAMPAGGTVTVSLCNESISADKIPGLESGNYVLFSVTDRGTGIPQDQLPRIFDPYFTTKEGGSGLGLATVYSIVQRHGGHVAVDSEVNRGTTFRVYLLASTGAVTSKEAPGEHLIAGRGRVLVMDDDELIRQAAGEMLRRLGYEVEFAQDGAEALEKYRQAIAEKEPLDLLIMDLTIPGGMGGMEAIQKLREIDPEVRAIVSSGYSSDPVMAEAAKYGFNGVVAKPYGIAELSSVLDDVMRKRELPGA